LPAFYQKKIDRVSLVYFYFSCFSSNRCDSSRAFYRKSGESFLVSFSFSSFTYSVGCLHFIKNIHKVSLVYYFSLIFYPTIAIVAVHSIEKTKKVF
jgi:hypothetical protein